MSFALLVAAGFGLAGCGHDRAPAPVAALQPAVDLDAVRPQVERFCGGCHAVPPPGSFPKDRWPHEVERGYEFYLLSGRTDLAMPRRSDVTEYYRRLAPDRLVFPPPARQPESKPGRFIRSEPPWPADARAGLAVAHILALPGSTSQQSELAWCDMQLGTVSWLAANPHEHKLGGLAQLSHPDHLCQTDLDGDGQRD
ncbi:MAG: hypothetical protein L0211_15645, partial [Planctomycetaceae bacterium]|nr:hypothetical protein [Planctomycetaceae bacterium]